MIKRASILFAIILLGIVTQGFAQDESPLTFGADLMSRYIWRGVNCGGNSPSLQPWMKYDMATSDSKHALTVGAWGAYTFSATSNQEADLYLIYTYNSVLSLTVTDYFFPGLYDSGERSHYFNYDKDSTSHVFEGAISFNGTDKIPFTLLFAMNVYGNDARKANGDLFMSKYVELGYKANVKGVDFNAFIGATLDNPDTDKGELGFYGNSSAGVINLGVKVSKSIKISDSFKLPVQASVITNPEAENIFFVFGMSF